MTDDGRSVGLVVLATGRYIEFVPPLLRSAQQHVAGLRRAYVLTDSTPPAVSDMEVVRLPWGQTPWPYSTLLRYRAITAYADRLRDVDVLLHLDADMSFVGPVDLTSTEGVFAVQHPGLVAASPAEFPYERRPESRACVPVGEGRVYVAGGVQGGSTARYLEACRTMADWLQTDLDAGLVPLWHDESMWNRYCISHPPAVVLPVDYCTPDVAPPAGARILALTKNHDLYRGVSLAGRIRRRSVRAIAKARSMAGRARRRFSA